MSYFYSLSVGISDKFKPSRTHAYCCCSLLEPFNATRYLSSPTYTALVNLHNNYERDVNTNEQHTPTEHNEQDRFINEITDTAPIRKLKKFLSKKGIFSVTFTNTACKLPVI